jgi:hypothetical protein
MLAATVSEWRRKRDSFARKPLIPRKLIISQLAELAQFARKHGFGSFGLQTRYSNSAIWRTAPIPSSLHKAILPATANPASRFPYWSQKYRHAPRSRALRRPCFTNLVTRSVPFRWANQGLVPRQHRQQEHPPEGIDQALSRAPSGAR